MSAISVIPSVLAMSSREIADLVNTSHDSVLRTVRELRARGVVSPTETQYQNEQNKQYYPEFRVGKRDALVIASGYSVELRARIIDRLEELENKSHDPAHTIPKTYAEALMLAANQAAQLEQQAPKVAVYDLLANTKGDVNTTIVAKELSTTANKLNQFLRDAGVKWLNADLPKVGYESWFNVVALEANGGIRHQCLITPKGQLEIAKLWGEK